MIFQWTLSRSRSWTVSFLFYTQFRFEAFFFSRFKVQNAIKDFLTPKLDDDVKRSCLFVGLLVEVERGGEKEEEKKTFHVAWENSFFPPSLENFSFSALNCENENCVFKKKKLAQRYAHHLVVVEISNLKINKATLMKNFSVVALSVMRFHFEFLPRKAIASILRLCGFTSSTTMGGMGMRTRAARLSWCAFISVIVDISYVLFYFVVARAWFMYTRSTHHIAKTTEKKTRHTEGQN